MLLLCCFAARFRAAWCSSCAMQHAWGAAGQSVLLAEHVGWNKDGVGTAEPAWCCTGLTFLPRIAFFLCAPFGEQRLWCAVCPASDAVRTQLCNTVVLLSQHLLLKSVMRGHAMRSWHIAWHRCLLVEKKSAGASLTYCICALEGILLVCGRAAPCLELC